MYIKREDAIEAIVNTYCKPCKEQGNDYNEAKCRACNFDDAILEIKDVPSAEAIPCEIADKVGEENERLTDRIGQLEEQMRWIPVSERLPKKEEKTYWVFLDSGGQCECRWTNDVFGLGSNEWSDWGWKILDKPQYTTVIAWRPLPTPYKGE